MQPRVPEKLKECRSGMFSVAVLTAEQVGTVAGLALLPTVLIQIYKAIKK